MEKSNHHLESLDSPWNWPQMRPSHIMVAADTSSLIAFSGIGAMELLRGIIPEVWIPPAVFREIVTQGEGWVQAKQVQAAILEAVWLKSWNEPFEVLSGHPPQLGRGEVEAISLAKDLGVSCLIDERRGRKFAQSQGVRPIGTIGVLVRAKEAGYIPQLKPILEGMIKNGIRFSPALISAVIAEAGE